MNNYNDMNKTPFIKKLFKVVVIAAVFGLVFGTVFEGVRYAGDTYIFKNKNVANETINEKQEEGQDSTAKDASVKLTKSTTAQTLSDVSGVVESVMPAIVAVTNITITEYRTWYGQSVSYEGKSAGSGIIISQDSDNIYIATNNHVVENSEQLTITFCDDTAVEGTIKGTDSSADLAVVAVKLSDIDPSTISTIKVATVGDSTKTKVGAGAIVIGNALGYGQSVSTGVISALDREIYLQDNYGNNFTNICIQTDAAVNPGNSGGALLDMDGEVIGIVSAKYKNASVEGMGYAIPISTANGIIEQMINNDVVDDADMPYMGIAGEDVNSKVAAANNVPTGIYVTRVVKGSPAEKAGIENKDVIRSVNGRSVQSMNGLNNILKYIKAGETIEVVVAKSDSKYAEEKLEITLENRNDMLR